jgi:hypothetical protein
MLFETFHHTSLHAKGIGYYKGIFSRIGDVFQFKDFDKEANEA